MFKNTCLGKQVSNAVKGVMKNGPAGKDNISSIRGRMNNGRKVKNIALR